MTSSAAWAARLRRRLAMAAISLFWLVVLACGAPAADALSLRDLPSSPPPTPVLDQADLLSRAARADISSELEELRTERVDARLITVSRLDYGLSLEQLGQQLLERWTTDADGTAGKTEQEPLLLLLIDGQNRNAAVVASPVLERQLPPELLRSTARTTMALPLREGSRYRQAAIDGLERLTVVLQGGDDPGEPIAAEETAVVPSNIPTREETASSNGFTWIVVLLVVGTIVPMLTWWVFSR